MIKHLIQSLLAKFGYTLMRIVHPEDTEEAAVLRAAKALVHKISPGLVVLNGPFKGMRYPTADIAELTLLPKLAGCYEKQLFPLIKELSEVPYENIIDVGCAEGYYAVGFASLFPHATIHCYDINERDLEFCQQMAALNGVSNLAYHNFCSPETLTGFNYGNRSFLLCDCEGYELELFTSEVVTALAKTEVLIECHDNLDPHTSETLRQRFATSHEVRMLNNSDSHLSGLEGLDHMTAAERAFAVLEHRGGPNRNIFMEWAFFTPKRSN